MNFLKHACLFLMLFFVCKPSYSQDLELWSQFGIEGKFEKNIKINLTTGARFRNNITNFYWIQNDIGVDYSFFSWLNGGIHYWHICKEKKISDTLLINDLRPYFFGTVVLNKSIIEVSDKNRLEYRMVSGTDNWFCYRNRPAISISIPNVSIGLKPYVADELFWNLNEKMFIENRVYIGLNFKFWKYLGIDSHYFLRTSKDLKRNEWIKSDVVGLNIKIGF